MRVEIPSKVSEVMTKDVVSVEEDDTLLHLLGSMKVLRFRHLPVTDEDRLIGLVSVTDLLGAASSNLLPHHGQQDRLLQERFRVRDIMVRDVVSVSPDTPLPEAGRLLLKHRLGCLPVIDANNVLLGILSASDFVGIIARARAERVPRGSGEPEQLQ
jgi:acetoin utilization protein AcuB